MKRKISFWSWFLAIITLPVAIWYVQDYYWEVKEEERLKKIIKEAIKEAKE